jgi:hypothetical protein
MTETDCCAWHHALRRTWKSGTPKGMLSNPIASLCRAICELKSSIQKANADRPWFYQQILRIMGTPSNENSTPET